MRIIDRYICREVLSHVLLAVGVFTFAVFVPMLVQLMDLLVRHSGGFGDVATLFLCSFPSMLTFTVPAGVLVGVLIGLSRMSADSELIAMTAVGVSLRRLLVPVGLIAAGAVTVTFCMTLWLGPLSVRTLRTLEDRLSTTQASFQVQPRVFDERFPNYVLYVQDVSAAATQWHGVFLAESGTEDTSRLTLAESAIVMADREEDKLQVHLHNGNTHEFSLDDPTHYDLSSFAQRDFSVPISGIAEQASRQITNAERSFRALANERGANAVPARIELHSRLAFPIACLVFALAAIPLGARARRGGRSAGLIIALLFVCVYYAIFVVGTGLARQGALPPWLGIWAANLTTGLIGALALGKIESSQGTGRLGHVLSSIAEWNLWHFWRRAPAEYREEGPSPTQSKKGVGNLAGRQTSTRRSGSRFGSSSSLRRRGRDAGMFPQILDLYLLRSFVLYFVLLTVAFLLMYEIITLFDLLQDISEHRTSVGTVVEYFRYLSYYLFYQLAPLSCLIAALVTLAVMAKNNELVAFKAAGISLYRIAAPLVVVAFIFAAGLFLLDSTYLPYANQRQDELRNQIKGRPAQTYYQPQRQWIFGNDSKIYNYQLFDRDRSLFGGLNVFELDPATFEVRRRVYAARAHWEEQQKAWVLESGWVRDFQGGRVTHFNVFPVLELAELNEPPSYFNREVRQSYQMDWWELRKYITELQQAGFDVARLSVQLQEKLAFPLITPIVVLLAIPFSILVGTRGAVGGLALGLGVSFVYRGVSSLSEAMGAIGQLPPALAAWSPDVIFLFLGLYFFLNMPT
jgi:LPS export ABC transporter permease LptF/LPS export ABC transporter permease LptG